MEKTVANIFAIFIADASPWPLEGDKNRLCKKIDRLGAQLTRHRHQTVQADEKAISLA